MSPTDRPKDRAQWLENVSKAKIANFVYVF